LNFGGVIFFHIKKWLFYLRKDASSPSGPSPWDFLPSSSRGGTLDCSKNESPKKTSEGRFKGKSWVILGEYPRYIPTYIKISL